MCCLAVLFIATAAMAQDTSDAKSTKLLDEVEKKFANYKNVVFTYKGNIKNKRSNTDMDIQGDAKLSGELYNVNYMGVTYISDGTKQYVINREDEQVTVSTVEGNSSIITPSNIFSFYNDGYVKQWGEMKDAGGRKIQYIKLTPIKSDVDHKQVMLGIDVNTKHIYNVIITENSDTMITFVLKSLKTDQPLAKNTFGFDAKDYPDFNVEVLD